MFWLVLSVLYSEVLVTNVRGQLGASWSSGWSRLGWLDHEKLKVHGLPAQVVLPVVGHDDEWEKERVVIFRSKQYVLGQCRFHQVVIVHEKVTTVWVHDYEAEVGSLIEKFKPTCLPLGKVLDLSNDVLGICSIFHLVLRELIVHLV